MAFLISFAAFWLMLFIFSKIFPTLTLPGISSQSNTSGNPQTQTSATPFPSSTPTPSPSINPGLTPVTLIIPKLGIQAAIEPVGVTATNNMDVPKKAEDAAWYKYGSRPSEEGNAVISAHYDTPTGKPALFYYLKKLEPGDEVTVISENAVKSAFVVVEKASIPYDKFPNEQVFKTRPGKNLNLITCGGIWDPRKKIYSERLVVYTTYKEIKI